MLVTSTEPSHDIHNATYLLTRISFGLPFPSHISSVSHVLAASPTASDFVPEPLVTVILFGFFFFLVLSPTALTHDVLPFPLVFHLTLIPSLVHSLRPTRATTHRLSVHPHHPAPVLAIITTVPSPGRHCCSCRVGPCAFPYVSSLSSLVCASCTAHAVTLLALASHAAAGPVTFHVDDLLVVSRWVVHHYYNHHDTNLEQQKK